jgi:hypothetical protein
MLSEKISTSFCEQKEAKKLLLIWAMGGRAITPMTQNNKRFLVLFFKKELLASKTFAQTP